MQFSRRFRDVFADCGAEFYPIPTPPRARGRPPAIKILWKKEGRSPRGSRPLPGRDFTPPPGLCSTHLFHDVPRQMLHGSTPRFHAPPRNAHRLPHRTHRIAVRRPSATARRAARCYRPGARCGRWPAGGAAGRASSSLLCDTHTSAARHARVYYLFECRSIPHAPESLLNDRKSIANID
jgi:hypothetical protein